MKSENEKQSNWWSSFTRFAVIIGFVASIAAIIGVYIQARSDSRTLEIQTLSADQLTSLPNVDGLSGEFSFKDIPVVDLWRLRLKFVNTGDVTLVGEGTSSMLLRSDITIQFPAKVTILDIDKLSGSFYSLTNNSPNSFTLKFTQWRQNEEFEVIIYLTANEKLNEMPLPSVPGRPLINGDVIVQSPSAQNDLQSQTVLDRLPNPIPLIGRILGILLASIVGLVSFIMFTITFPIEYIKVLRWKRAHIDEINDLADKLKYTSSKRKEALNEPWTLKRQYDHIFWNWGGKSLSKFSEKLNVTKDQLLPYRNLIESIPSSPLVDTFSGFCYSILGGLGMFLICGAIIAGLIKM